mmetsp:Transcript_1706/g.4949  ORF Transcript_1706/g.4949 Transcript_1706/m.4949 type:complete len:1096 (+) Transcript_1706:257-3544(+)|eukprot:CAMPEP_0206141590 /NCGR_PEP_ID=MMETSP1473-20131121/13485_1 /ASSEMBLY_ACC=CAM_ASM_001109 /TAXON_ID=1461547 /ORGANISM="Stichococcus sp, Strain RCC1054" /LENGTH=1095 /DNA_ID=CAMNT_0053536217 /DNA_START=249 /DNA_END=3536 /DNA_ORIENTATION=+
MAEASLAVEAGSAVLAHEDIASAAAGAVTAGAFLDKQIPRSWTWVLSLFFLIVVFLSSQKTKLHFSRTLRRGIWATISTGFLFWTISCLQALDFGSSLWDFCLVCAAGIVIASLIEDHLQRRYYLVPWAAKVKIPAGTPEAIGKADYVSTLIDQISSGLGATVGLAQVLARAINVRARRLEALHDVLNSADEAELNFMLGGGTINCAALVEVAKTETMEMLTAFRLQELSIPSRAALLDGLMKVGMRNRMERQHFALNILLSTYGSDLTFLKGLIDDGGDHHIMYKLVYNDFQNRNQVDALQHIATEGNRARDEFQAKARRSHPAQPGLMLKIVSDIDDTLMSSGGAFPAGCDRAWPRRCVYPGVLAFFSEMDIAQALRVQAVEAEADMDLGDGDSVAGNSDNGDASGSESLTFGGVSSTAQQWNSATNASSGGWVRGGLNRFRSNAGSGRRRGSHAGRSGLLGTTAGEDLGLKDLPDRSDIAEVLSGGAASYPQPQDAEEDSRSGFRETLREAAAGARAVASLARRLAGKTLGAPLAHLTVLRPRAEHLQPAVQGGDCTLPVEKDESKRPHQPGANLVFLSARPESYEGTTEAMSFSSIFSPLIRRSELYCSPVLLLGSIASGPRSMLHYALGIKPKHAGIELVNDNSAAASFYTALAGKKLVRFQQYAALFPEAAFVFLGDNGQGDVLVAEALAKIFARMAGRDGGPNRLCACFIHDVVPPPRQPVSGLRETVQDDTALRSAWASQRIFHGGTYVGLAIQAFKMGLLDIVGLQHVAVAACKDLRWARCRYAMEPTNWALNAAQINHDIQLANEHLPAELQVSPIELPACEHIFEGASSSDTMSDTGSIPSNGPWAAMHGSGGHHGSRSPAGGSPTAFTAGNQLRARSGSSFSALRQRMSAAPLRTPPASPARAAALHTDASLHSSGELGAGRGVAAGMSGVYGSSPPRSIGAAGGGIPPLSAAVLERHGRGNLGLPPLPQVRAPMRPSSSVDNAEAGSGAVAAAAATAAVSSLNHRESPTASQASGLTTALRQQQQQPQPHMQRERQPDVPRSSPATDVVQVASDGTQAAEDAVAEPVNRLDEPSVPHLAMPQ